MERIFSMGEKLIYFDHVEIYHLTISPSLKTHLAIRSGRGGVHLVDTDDELLNSESVSEESVLAGLSILGDTGFELTSTGGDDEHTAIGLGGASDHVLDEIPLGCGQINTYSSPA